MLEDYAAVERSYSAGHFDQALAQAESLIARLQAPEEQPMRLRLELLVGHCCLYGLAQPERAADSYRLVAEQSPEAVLREIALQGLERCAGKSPGGDAAMPWLQQTPPAATGDGTPEAAGALPWEAAAAAVPDLPEPPQASSKARASQNEAAEPPAAELLIPELVGEAPGDKAAARAHEDWSAAKDEEDLAQSLLLVEL